ncbi:MAG TPA: type II toxin-antitoxin system RelE/ParE family toxin [Micropepsaceae bacterium]|jgi:hypothetical protein|nr:type II toxin-antitoxin system RelE/ParE family toxin [Micropepsaceae bacterium]
MRTVVELASFIRASERCGLSADGVSLLIGELASNPKAGDEMPGTGGCRKLRLAGRGKGKSGGYRVITFYSGREIPLFLITVYAKGERANLTKAECNDLKKLTAQLSETYRKNQRKLHHGQEASVRRHR